MMSEQVVKELKQIRGILCKLVPCDAPKPHRVTATAENVTRLTRAAIGHLNRGHKDIARQLLLLLIEEEGA